MKFSSITLFKGVLGYVVIIVFTLIFYPNENEFATRLANQLIPLFIFWMGAAIFDLIEMFSEIFSSWGSRKSNQSETK